MGMVHRSAKPISEGTTLGVGHLVDALHRLIKEAVEIGGCLRVTNHATIDERHEADSTFAVGHALPQIRRCQADRARELWGTGELLQELANGPRVHGVADLLRRQGEPPGLDSLEDVELGLVGRSRLDHISHELGAQDAALERRVEILETFPIERREHLEALQHEPFCALLVDEAIEGREPLDAINDSIVLILALQLVEIKGG